MKYSIVTAIWSWVIQFQVKTTALSIKFKIFLKWKRTKESHFHDNSIWQFARTISLEFKMMPKPSGGLISPNLLPQLRSSPSPRYKSKIKIIFKFLQSLSRQLRCKRKDPSVFTITEKAPTRAFSWLKAPTSFHI